MVLTELRFRKTEGDFDMVRRRFITVLPLLLLFSFLSTASGNGPVAEDIEGSSSLLIILDGLRPDYVTPDLMPNLCALGKRGVVCEAHHSVFPTVTRVNSASVATGSTPAITTFMGNGCPRVSCPSPATTPSITVKRGGSKEARSAIFWCKRPLCIVPFDAKAPIMFFSPKVTVADP